MPPGATAVNPELLFGVGSAALRVTAVALRRLGLGMSGPGPGPRFRAGEPRGLGPPTYVQDSAGWRDRHRRETAQRLTGVAGCASRPKGGRRTSAAGL